MKCDCPLWVYGWVLGEFEFVLGLFRRAEAASPGPPDETNQKIEPGGTSKRRIREEKERYLLPFGGLSTVLHREVAL
jgi:hypothetical protein